MNQSQIGMYIARKRKELNMSQAVLAEKIGVSNKTISKWENGKCMPDYSVIQLLCDELDISISELMDGEDKAEASVRLYDEEQVLELIERTQGLEHDKDFYIGLLLFAISMSSLALHISISGLKELNIFGIIQIVFNVLLMIAGVGMASIAFFKKYHKN